MTRAYVVIEDGQVIILGYHAINLGMMNADELTRRPRGAPDHGELPILFLGQVAVSISAQGHGIGSILMHRVFEKPFRIAVLEPQINGYKSEVCDALRFPLKLHEAKTEPA